MKKLLFASAAVLFLAAGCNSSSQTQDRQSATQSTQQQAQTPPSQTQTDVQADANIKVNGADDAVNQLEKDSGNEQAKASAGDDADLTSSDSAELNGFTEVPNGN